jgi:myo-inositol-1(or 4)-monophosphatase
MKLEAYLQTAVQAAKAAGAIHLYHRDQDIKISSKSNFSDLVTVVDRLSEEKIREIILSAYTDHAILGEEGGTIGEHHEARWVIDPLDGTVNYAHGFPCSCVSIGLELEGVRTVGVVFDPNRQELFTAIRGRGAFLNGQRIHASSCTDLRQPALLTTGFPYDVAQDRRNLEVMGRFLALGLPVRRPGSAALDLCYVACGRFEGYWEHKINPWDVSAGLLLLEEAGGKHSNFEGKEYHYGDALLATNGHIHTQMLEVIQAP